MNNRDVLKNGLEDLGVAVDDKILNDFNIYREILVDWNQKMNLTGIEDEKEVYIKHFLDSVAAVTNGYIKDGVSIIDVGTGAGFPGLPLRICLKNIELTLLDSLNKRINFLQEVSKQVEIDNIKFIHGRAEELPTNYREYFDIVTSRAVANLRVLTELSIPYLKVNGYFISLKGKADEELKEAESTLKVLNCEIEKIEKFILPDQVSERSIIKIRKEKETPDIYPRKYDKIKKQFLK